MGCGQRLGLVGLLGSARTGAARAASATVVEKGGRVCLVVFEKAVSADAMP